MNKTAAITLVVIGSLVLLGLAFGFGLWIGHFNISNMMVTAPYSMMRTYDNAEACDYSMMGGGYRGMGFNNYACEADTMRSSSFMPRWHTSTATTTTDPITVDQANTAFQEYLDTLNNDDLEIAEIMTFDNNAYARIAEKSTGIGAMELLAEPGSLVVHPEYGPNMMWNLKYGHMGSTGYAGMRGGMMGGGMMGAYSYNDIQTEYTEMTVSEEEALQIAQDYLDEQFPGTQTADEANPFYGYYTLDYLKDGSPVGMLSVNGYTGQVFLHTWHGTFVDMVE